MTQFWENDGIMVFFKDQWNTIFMGYLMGIINLALWLDGDCMGLWRKKWENDGNIMGEIAKRLGYL